MPWTQEEDEALLSLRDEGLSFRQIAAQLGKSETTIGRRFRLLIRPEEGHTLPEFPDLIRPEMDVDEVLDQLEAMQSLRMKLEPVTTSASVHIETNKPIAFTPTSCWHLGGLYTFHEGFRQKFREVLEIDRFYWGTHGDDWESFPPGWGSTVFNNLIPPHLQRQLVAKIVDKLASAGKLLYSCWGNHPAFMEKLTGEDQQAVIYADKVPYFAGRGIVKLHVGDQRYILAVAHSFPGHSYLNPSHSQSRELTFQVPQADFVIQGHKHTFAYQERVHHGEAYDAGLQENRIAHLVQTGTAKSGPDPFTLRGWNRGVFIWPTFVLSAKRHDIHRVYDTESLRWYLGRDDF